MRRKAVRTTHAPRPSIAGCENIYVRIPDHERLLRGNSSLSNQGEQSFGVRFLGHEAIAPVRAKKIRAEAKRLTDRQRGTDRLVGEHRHGSRRACRLEPQAIERWKNPRINVGLVEF